MSMSAAKAVRKNKGYIDFYRLRLDMKWDEGVHKSGTMCKYLHPEDYHKTPAIVNYVTP
jgi:hypothetical protein